MQAVIYIFRCPKGRVYAGWRGVSPEALRRWPHRGIGPLPDGYTGSGTAWEGVARKHSAALVWRILARVDGTRADVGVAERRAIRLARALFGRLCLNIRDGGQGMTRADAQRLWADPAYSARTGAAIREAFARPEVRAKVNAAANTPDALAKLTSSHKALAQTAHRREQLARATAASLSPEARAKRNTGQSEEAQAKRRASLKAYAATPEGKAVHNSPSVQARRLLTRAINEYRRFVAAHPELF